MIINIECELEKITFSHDSEQYEHVKNFHRLMKTLGSFYKPVTEEEKSSKFIRTLITITLFPIAKVTESSNLSFNHIFASFKAGISQREDKEAIAESVGPIGSSPMASAKDSRKKSAQDVQKNNNKPSTISGKSSQTSEKC